MSTNVSSVISHFPDVENGFTTTTAGSVSSGATTVTLNSVAGYTNGEPIVLVIDPTDSSKKQTFTGIVDTSGVQVTSVVWTAGSNQSHALGATVVDYATATHIAMISKGIKVEHKQAGTHSAVTADSVTVATGKITTTTASKLEDAAIPLSTYRTENTFDFVASGGVWTGDAYASTRAGSMTAIVCYINGQRLTVSAVTAHTFTASKDTYVDILNTSGVGSVVYTEATNNAASPALAANSVRIGVIITGATTIADVGSINQGQENKVLPIASSIPYAVTDSLGNLICPRDPQRKLLGSKRLITNSSGYTGGQVQLTGMSCPVIVPTGRKVKISFNFGSIQISGTGSPLAYIWEGVVSSGTQLYYSDATNLAAGAADISLAGSVVRTPSSSSVTYNIGFGSTASTATINASASNTPSMTVELV